MVKQKITGKVVSNKMEKTVIVEVERIKEHPKYRRRYRVSKRYKAHDEKGEYEIGDKVLIEECRPLSKEKRWKVIKKIIPHTEEGKEESLNSPAEENGNNE